MHYYKFSTYLKRKYGEKVRRISLNAGFTCPNKDGSKGTGGCVFCNEFGFSEFPGHSLTLEDQIEISIKRARDFGKADKFIAYFQNATNTYSDIETLKKTYDTIKKYPEIAALYISTRPDCVDSEKLDLVNSYSDNYEVWIEYGVQTVHDKTLSRITRGHTFEESKRAIEMTAERNIKAGAHIILGLPGETKEDMIETAKKISRLPVAGIKLHQMQVLKETELAVLYSQGKVDLMSRAECIDIICAFLENTREDCVILRLLSDAKKEFLIAPEWINDKLALLNEIEKEMTKRNIFQGDAVN